MKKRTKKLPYTISIPPPKKEIVVKMATKISFLNPGWMSALLKNNMINGVQMTDRKQERSEWTDRR
jgi:hypothetical protein